ncbi:hypothetical protein Mapa_006008 [Marchantia paleacea]|nr:hypothetical protein Mapa_006008 [Marchantia paleacea]
MCNNQEVDGLVGSDTGVVVRSSVAAASNKVFRIRKLSMQEGTIESKHDEKLLLPLGGNHEITRRGGKERSINKHCARARRQNHASPGQIFIFVWVRRLSCTKMLFGENMVLVKLQDEPHLKQVWPTVQ